MRALTWIEVERILKEIADGQKRKLLACGRSIVPTLTPEDMLQPNDYMELENNPYFRYEEGVLEGVQTVWMALSALVKDIPEE